MIPPPDDDDPFPLPPMTRPPHPLQDALDELGASGEGFRLDTTATRERQDVQLAGTKTFGRQREWSASAAIAWTKDKARKGSAAVMATLRWRPGP